MKIQWKLNYLFYFSIDVIFQKYKLLWVGHEQRSSGIGDSQTSLGKIGIKVQLLSIFDFLAVGFEKFLFFNL
jgi:hypothetical protein